MMHIAHRPKKVMIIFFFSRDANDFFIFIRKFLKKLRWQNHVQRFEKNSHTLGENHVYGDVSLTFFRIFLHQLLGFINLVSEFLLILRKFWPKNFKTSVVSQQLKKQQVGPLECSAVPGGMSGGRSGARSGLGCATGLPMGFNFVNRVSWMASNI